MAQTLLFVHGTGVREAGYRASVAVIEKQMKKYAPTLGLAQCRWGDSVGAKLHFEGASIPSYGESLGVSVTEEEKSGAIWELLLRDPGFELGMLSAGQPEAGARPPDAAAQVEEMLDKFHALPRAMPLKARLQALALEVDLATVVDAIERTPGFEDAKQSALAGLPPHRDALARALVAGLQMASLEAGAPTLDAASRDELAIAIAPMLGDDAYGAFATVMSPFVGLAKSVGTWQIRRKRTSLTDTAYPVAGDILLYQARGEAIRNFIRDAVAEHPHEDVFLFAHSLGGIACFELLVEDTPANVKGLITFGSQAPFFYEIGALRSLGVGDALPAHFPPWLNFYDLSDPLSYAGENLKPFENRVSDQPVESRESFPASHSAYLHSEPMWRRLEAWVRCHA